MTGLDASRASAILRAGAAVRILIVGDLMLDRYLRGEVDRISPEAPVPVLRINQEDAAVGGAANVAANILAVGASCSVVGCVGDDESGRDLVSQLETLGADTSGVVTDADRPTTVKTRVMARRQQIVRVDREIDSDLPDHISDEVIAKVEDGLRTSDALVVQDYNKGVLVPRVIRASLDGAREHGLTSVVDPKRWRFFDYGEVTVFKPNARELEEALGEPLRPTERDWLEDVRVRLQADNLLLTLGEAGMVLQDAEGRRFEVPATARSVYDVSGAGDTVTAILAVALAAGASVCEAAELANHAAAIVVGKAGVQSASIEEIVATVSGRGP